MTVSPPSPTPHLACFPLHLELLLVPVTLRLKQQLVLGGSGLRLLPRRLRLSHHRRLESDMG